MSKSTDVVAIAAARAPLGGLDGTPWDVPTYDLGAAIIRATLEREKEQLRSPPWPIRGIVKNSSGRCNPQPWEVNNDVER